MPKKAKKVGAESVAKDHLHGQNLDRPLAYFNGNFDEGALTAREKSLIALAVGFAVSCNSCVETYTRSCEEYGVDEKEIIEALKVASAIRGGASLPVGLGSRPAGAPGSET
jgi:AhpD family alkylhydroperoxidase